MKRGRTGATRPAYEEEEEDGSEQGYSNAEKSEGADDDEEQSEYTQTQPSRPSIKREPVSRNASSRKAQRSQPTRTHSQRGSQACATPHTQQGTQADGAGAGLGPSSERQEQRRQLQPLRSVQPQPGDVQKLHAKITKYRQEEAARKEEGALPLDDSELALLAGNVVRYMLFAHYEKPSVPVSRTKLNEAILVQYSDHPRKRKIPPVVMAMAQRRMLSVFGIELMEVERPSDSKKDDAGNKFYVLRSALPSQVREAYVPCPLGDKGPDQGLLTVVLAFILMQGGKLKEEDLWDSLEKLGVQREQTHPYFGKVKEAVQKLEATRYIIRRKLPTAPGGQASYCYEWGECAQGEIEPEDVRSFIDSLFSKREQRRQQDV